MILSNDGLQVVFLSNFLNHHQLPLCNELLATCKSFYFIATTPIPQERLKLGYQDLNMSYGFVLRTYDKTIELETIARLIEDSDVLIYGDADFSFVKERLKKNKLTFKYSERIFKNELKGVKLLRLKLGLIRSCFFYKRNYYLLTASAFAYNDYSSIGCFVNKAYRWGYFPATDKYDINEILNVKVNNSILWVGRLIDWKHPEVMIEIASKLRNKDIPFSICLIGDGPLKSELQRRIEDLNLSNQVSLLGAIPSEQVRQYMLNSQIFVFTSDRNEGWGAVLNESMNSGCAVIANSAIGSVPFLIKDNENGMIYKNGCIDELYEKVIELIADKNKCVALGCNSYKTMIETWSPQNAAHRFLQLSEKIINGDKHPKLFDEGPCSCDRGLKDNWC